MITKLLWNADVDLGVLQALQLVGGGSWGKVPEKFCSYYIWRANKELKKEET